MHFKRVFKTIWHSQTHKKSGKKPPGPVKAKDLRGKTDQAFSHARKGKTGNKNKEDEPRTGTVNMARFDIQETEMAAMGNEARAEMFCEMGLMYATGNGCDIDLVVAHKWLNIAAIKGSAHAASCRADLAQNMTKADLALALRAAREWMTMH